MACSTCCALVRVKEHAYGFLKNVCGPVAYELKRDAPWRDSNEAAKQRWCCPGPKGLSGPRARLREHPCIPPVQDGHLPLIASKGGAAGSDFRRGRAELVLQVVEDAFVMAVDRAEAVRSRCSSS